MVGQLARRARLHPSRRQMAAQPDERHRPVKAASTESVDAAEIPEPRALELDPTKLGEILLKLIPASASATHGTVAMPLRDYVHPRGNAELEFIRYLFTRSPDETAYRWY